MIAPQWPSPVRCLRWLLAAAIGFAPVVHAATIDDCSQESLEAALEEGGVISFDSNCSIVLTNTIRISVDAILVANGHTVSISGSNRFRLFNVLEGVNFEVHGIQLTSGRSGSGAGLYINPAASVTLSNCTLQANQALGAAGLAGIDGKDQWAIADDGSDGSSGGAAFGGAVYNLGDLTALACRFLTNSATGGAAGNGGKGGAGGTMGGNGGDGGNGGNAVGGAIWSRGTLRLQDCLFIGNSAVAGNGGQGGAAGAGPVAASRGNGGQGGHSYGAAVFADASTIVNSTFQANAATGGNSAAGGTASSGSGTDGKAGGSASGAAICISSAGVAALTNNTFTANRAIGGKGADGGSGAPFAGDGGNGGAGSGAAVYSAGTAHIVNCTIARNLVVGGTNGVAGSGSYAGVNGTVGAAAGGGLAAAAGAIYLQNSILSSNAPGANAFGSVVDRGYNLSSDASPALSGSSRNNVNARLGTFGANGGFTPTFTLRTNSPAIDKIPAALCPPTDQRGVARPVNGRGDIGAVEIAYYLAGTVTIGSNGLAGVQVKAGDIEAVTDASGKFLLPTGSGTFNVVPELAGFSFNPASRSVTISSGSVSNVNFAASQLFSVSGRVLEFTNGLAGVDLRLISPVSTNNVTSTSNGTYTFSGLTTNIYAVVPTLNGYRFDPPSRILSISATTNNVNFSAIPLLNSGVNTNGNLQIGFGGQTGAVYTVEASTNLTGWAPIATNTAPFLFVDPASTNFPTRYYRMIRQ